MEGREKAKELETRANSLRRNIALRKSENLTPEDVGEMLIHAAKIRDHLNDFNEATDDYRSALQYAFTYDKNKRKEIEDALNDLRQKKAYHFFKGGKKLYPAILPIVSFLLALFFISSNLTGFAISSTNASDSNWLGTFFFIFGLVFTFIYFKEKSK